MFILSPGADPANMVTSMATMCNKKENVQSLSMGKGLESSANK